MSCDEKKRGNTKKRKVQDQDQRGRFEECNRTLLCPGSEGPDAEAAVAAFQCEHEWAVASHHHGRSPPEACPARHVRDKARQEHKTAHAWAHKHSMCADKQPCATCRKRETAAAAAAAHASEEKAAADAEAVRKALTKLSKQLSSDQPIYAAHTSTCAEGTKTIVDIVADAFKGDHAVGTLLLTSIVQTLTHEVDRLQVRGSSSRVSWQQDHDAGGAAAGTNSGTSHFGAALDQALRSQSGPVVQDPVVVCVCGTLGERSAGTVGNNQAPDSGSPVLAIAAAAIADMGAQGLTTAASGVLRDAAGNALALSHWLSDLLDVGVRCCFCGRAATVCCPQCRPSTPAYCATCMTKAHTFEGNQGHCAFPLPNPNTPSVSDRESNSLLWAGYKYADVIRLPSAAGAYVQEQDDYATAEKGGGGRRWDRG
jgi:hypothetical protein